MPDKKVLKELKKQGFFYFVKSNEVIIPLQGNKANELLERFYELVEQRGIPNTILKRFTTEQNQYLIISHKINPDIKADITVNPQEYGKDLRINLLFGHFDKKKYTAYSMVGGIITVIGLFSFWTGVGLLALIGGIVLSKNAVKQFSADFENERDSFYSTILGILSDACEETGIEFNATQAIIKPETI